jgi:Tfp pilus assembly protein PilF
MRLRFLRHGSAAAAIGMVGVAGCLHFNQPAAQAPASPEVAGKLTAAQRADLQIARGRSLEKQGDAPGAAAAYEQALKQDATRSDACLRLGILRDQEGRFKESRELFQKALAGKPGNAEVFCDMGYSLYLQHRWDEAEMNLRQCLALAPSHARAHNNLGLVFASTGRTEEALAEFRRAGCTEADAQCNLAFIQTVANDLAAARERYAYALAADASSETAKKGLREIEQLLARGGAAAAERPSEAPRNGGATGESTAGYLAQQPRR